MSGPLSGAVAVDTIGTRGFFGGAFHHDRLLTRGPSLAPQGLGEQEGHDAT
jgi:hypothetical protein